MAAESPDSAEELRSLQEWLASVEELRGRVTADEAPPPAGKLGPVLETLVVALGPGGAVTAFSVAVLAWLRTRRGDVRIKLTLPGRSLEVTARRVSGLDAETLRQQVADMADTLAREGAEGEAEAITGGGSTTGGSGRRELP
ncbi:effector-associated constant component EACC1 [Streptomyces sp. TE33382]